MSFDSAASPSITVYGRHDQRSTDPPQSASEGWGFGWYPNDDTAGVVIKNPSTQRESVMTRVLRDWDRFRSSTFVCHMRGAAKRASQQDTLPFLVRYAGRHWIFTHSGKLSKQITTELTLGEDPVFEPVGKTDSEHAFCWLLTQLRQQKARTLAGAGWNTLHELFDILNRYGTANFMITDGQTLVAYRDEEGAGELYHCRRKPPFKETILKNAFVEIDFGDPLDQYRTMFLLSSTPLNYGEWHQFKPGQMIASRLGKIVWNSHSDLMIQPESESEGAIPTEPYFAAGHDEQRSSDSHKVLRATGGAANGQDYEKRRTSEDLVIPVNSRAEQILSQSATSQKGSVLQDSLKETSKESLEGYRKESLKDSSADFSCDSLDNPRDIRAARTTVMSHEPQGDFCALTSGEYDPIGTNDCSSLAEVTASLTTYTERIVNRPRPGTQETIVVGLVDAHAHPQDKPKVLSVFHQTFYEYKTPVEYSTHRLHVQPVHDLKQELIECKIDVSPTADAREFEDVFGNHCLDLVINERYSKLLIKVESKVRVYPQPHLRSRSERMTVPLVWMPWQRQMMLPYLLPPELPESELRALTDYAMGFVKREDYDLLEALLEMNRSIFTDFEYVSGSTKLTTTPFEVLVERKGVCQDFANLFICMARLLGIPARYRVGYINTGADYENKVQSEASHAWAELYLPWFGWYGFDPTNGCLVGSDHVRVAAGRNYRDASPTSGTIYKGGGGEKLNVAVRVMVENEE